MTAVALVTGAGRGLGAALARRLAADGYALALHYHRSVTGAERVAADIRGQGGEAEVYAGDLSREADCQRIASAIAQRFGRLDLLLNNAGVYREKPGPELTAAEWFEGLDTTVTQVFFMTRASLPLLRAGGRKRIINIGDSSCDRPGARDLAWSYHIGKTGVYMLTRSFAATEARHGIAVNLVSPGYLVNSVGLPDPSEIPAGRLGEFDDVYGAVRFLACEAPDYLTGSHLVVSGGWNLR